MRLKQLGSIFLLALSLSIVAAAHAQSPSVEWTAWNAQITAHANGAPLDIAETQIIQVKNGQIHSGERDFSQPVTVQMVFLAVNGGQPQQLQQGSGANTYQVTQTSSDVILDYQLPAAANAGDNFVVQINYTVSPPASGLIDWFVVPGTHGAPVDSSKVTLNFPDGTAPDASFVRVPQGSGTVTTSGNSIIVQSQGALPANQPFEIQIPYGAGIGAAGNSGNTSTVQTAPAAGTSSDTSGGFGSILTLLCVLGVAVVLGGGGLLRGVLGGGLGGILGGGGGSIFGGGSSGGFFGGNSTSGGSSGGRGFRESSNQNREAPTINNDKQSGGGASFK